MKTCPYCSQQFIDTSRGKNKRFCSSSHLAKFKWANEKTKLLEYNKKYEAENKEAVQRRKAAYRRERYAHDINFKLNIKLRVRLKQALQKSKDLTRTNELLGCSINDFKTYIESKFQRGMSWDNYGKYGWHIDHIVPLSRFDLSDSDQLLKSSHYTNLQPLWAEDNHRKSNK